MARFEPDRRADPGQPPPHRRTVETRLLPRFMAPRRRHLVVYEGGRSAGG